MSFYLCDAAIPAIGSADLVGGVAKDERAHQIRPSLVERLRDQPADGEAANDGVLDVEQIKQPGEIGGVILDRIRHLADIGEAMATLVVEHDSEIAGEPDDHVAPDAEIRAKRIGKDKHRLVTGSTDDLIMDRDVVDTGELHWKSPR